MSINSHHPQYAELLDTWQKMRDSYKGERVIKARGTKYLPATAGMIADGMQVATAEGYKAFEAYKLRATFPDFVNDAVKANLGAMHHKPPVIEVPKAMEPLLEKATIKGESLEMLLQRINEEQLLMGRCGVFVDLPATGGELPYFVLYGAEQIINWDDGSREIGEASLNLVVLDESEFERTQDLNWEVVDKYRVLVLGDLMDNEAAAPYSVGVYKGENSNLDVTTHVTPVYKGKGLDFVPFTFINARDIVPDVDDPPMSGLADTALTIYRGEADYRQALFMQGQDTLVIVGGNAEETYRVGAGGILVLAESSDAKYVGVSSQGLPEMRAALQNDRTVAGQKGGQLMDSVSRERESGDALRIRVAARTASLTQIAIAGAFGLEQSLKHAATWLGLNPEDVSVTPNLDFVDDVLDGQQLTQYITAKNAGAPLSLRSLHELMQDRGLTNRTFEEELEELDEEAELVSASTSDAPVDQAELPADDMEDDEDDGEEMEEANPADVQGS